jgi:hypothetical protein
MGAINLLHDAFDALWAVVATHDISPEALLGLKQKVQGLLMEYDSSANPLGHYGTHGIDRNRNRLLTAVRDLYEEGAAELPLLELMFSTPDTPEYTAMTDLLVRYIAVRDELTSDSDSSDSDSSDSDSD